MSHIIEIISLFFEFLILVAIVDPRFGKAYLKMIAKKPKKRKAKKQFIKQLETLFNS